MLITAHAVQRYQERVADVPVLEAMEALSCDAVKAAIKFGAKVVKLHGGQRIIIQGQSVVTVIPHTRINRNTLRIWEHEGVGFDG